MKAVGAYIYAGGFSLGVERAGFEVTHQLEGDGGYGVDTARLNWPNREYRFGPSKWELEELRGAGIDWAFCNPPCAIFSSAGVSISRGHDAWRTDPRLDHWWDCFRVLETVQPRAWCLESVTQAYTKGREVIDEMTKRALMGGYSVTHLLVNAKWLGVPQKRKRFFIMAHKPSRLVGYQPNWAPPDTVGEVLSLVDDPGYYAEVDPRHYDAVVACRPMTGLREAWESINPGFENNRNHLGQVKGRPRLTDSRLGLDCQMGAFIGNSYIHPTEHRWLGIQEMKALCGYPQDFQLAGKPSDGPSLLARAVLPPVGHWLGRAVMAMLQGPDGGWADRRVFKIDLREPDKETEDLTPLYLNERGQVKARMKADRSIDYSGYWEVPKKPKIKVLRGIEKTRQILEETTVEFSQALENLAKPVPEGLGSPGFQPSGLMTTPMGDEFVIRCLEFPKAEPNEKSGQFIERMIRETELDAGEMTVAVHRSFANRKTRVSDIRYNYQAMVTRGEQVRPWLKPVLPGVPSDGNAERSKKNVPDEIINVFVNRGVGPLIAMTGCTSIQTQPRQNEMKGQRNDFPSHVAKALGQLNVNLDWRPSQFDRPMDALICWLAPLTSLTGCRYAFQALWTLAEAYRRKIPTVVCYDDWTVRIIHTNLRLVSGYKYGESFKRRMVDKGFAVRKVRISAEDVDRHRDGIQEIAGMLGRTWPSSWTGVYPAYRWGDPEVMKKISGASKLIRIDPTPVSVDLSYKYEDSRNRRWMMAAINDYKNWVNAKNPQWPVYYVGRKEYGPKLPTEADVLRETSASRGVFAPPYNSLGAQLDGSGWYRLRYVYAALGGSVLMTDTLDQRELGEPYQITVPEVEALSDSQLDDLAARQRRELIEGGKCSLTHDDWLADVKKIVEALK